MVKNKDIDLDFIYGSKSMCKDHKIINKVVKRLRTGFTLIELLVVIAIIALLMSILMPSLNRVKEHARSVACLANMKGWNLTFSMYVGDNNGKFPSGMSSQGFWYITQFEDRIQSYKQNPLWFCPTAKKPIRDKNGNDVTTLNIFNAWGIYKRGQAGIPNEICDDGIAGSYGLNGYVLSTKPGITFEGGRETANNWRTPNVPGASEIPLFIDSLRFDLWPLDTDAPASNQYAGWVSTNHMARCCINRHDGFVNSAFCDFSARNVGLKELWTLKWHRNFNTSNFWTTPGGVVSTDWPEWMWNLKDY